MAQRRRSGKLAVLLHADVASSTSLVHQDEHLAHERIRTTFKRLGDAVTRYHGRVRELRGDALLAEFERASDAVTAALAFQVDQAGYIGQIEDDIRPAVRIGIAMGEVVFADRTVTGAGVVLAQRLEQLAEPGGVCITSAIHESLPKRMPFAQASLGDRDIKGFDEPVRVYAVQLKKGVDPPEPTELFQSNRSPAAIWTIAAAVLVLVCGGAYLAWHQLSTPGFEPASAEDMALPLPDKPSIAVLPFTNMSADQEQEYFVDGITEDLITDLSKVSGLFVIAPNSVFTYKGRSVKVSHVAEDLGVRYILEGSVRRSGHQVRINAQLIDAITGGHLWAERYDGTLTDIFSLQDKVTAKIVNALAVQLTDAEEKAQQVVETNSTGAYDAFLQGWSHYRKQTPDDFTRAKEYFEEAVERDRDYSRAYAALSLLYWETHLREWHPALRLDRTKVKAGALRYRDLAMEEPTSLARIVAADMLMWTGRHEEALDEAKRATEMAPNDAYVSLKLAEILIFSGRPAEALEYVSKASRLDPHGEPRQRYIQGLAEFGLENYTASAKSLAKALQLNPDFEKPIAILVAAKGHLGEKDAATLIEPYNNEYWGQSVLNTLLAFPYKEEADRMRLARGLRKAGMREYDI